MTLEDMVNGDLNFYQNIKLLGAMIYVKLRG